ncbi:hypothetical protein PYW07_010753 [Mythimna separata]|uniref:Protein cueball n=1 Tax=Mythimna separata TaxID=271217 RepID=A0AAD8DKP2_MYTSE|nr:hypothetical protein PYW07_010753 [Mythimna separata]
MSSTRVLTLLALLVGSVHCFSWDIVVGGDKELAFYYNGTLTHTEGIPSAYYIQSVTYDPVQYRVIFADNNNLTITISSFDLSTRKIQPLMIRKSKGDYIIRVVYDFVTQTLFWKDGYADVYSFSLNPTSHNKASDGDLLFNVGHFCQDIAVDSCGGYIYWVTNYKIERARLDGSEREVLLVGYVFWRTSLAIDQQTQKIYWIEINRPQVSIESANFKGKNRTTLYIAKNESVAHSLAVSKQFIFWQNVVQNGISQLPKNPSQNASEKLYKIYKLYNKRKRAYCHRIAVNYTIQDQIQGIKSCEAIKIPNNSKPVCTVSVCQNYCLEGDCSVNADTVPKCSCKAGYSGERCEVNACHKHCLNGGVCSLDEEDVPVCQCTAGYDGGRCDVSICKDYCLQGNCSVSAEGQPKCSCKTGYSGDRCEVNACLDYCLNGGVCSLNEEEEPACQCTAGYDGRRCDVSVTEDFCFQAACSVNAEGQPEVTVAVGKGAKSPCASTVV